MGNRPVTLRAALACGLLLLSLHGAQAQKADDPFAEIAPSIARLNFSGFRTMGHCTAVQAGLRSAFVAGGCIKAGSFGDLHLLFGYDRQIWSEHRTGKAAFNDPARSELKLLCLDRDLPVSRLGAAGEAPSGGERVIVAGYTMPASHRLSFKGCGVAQARDDSGFALGCNLAGGSAGAPVFVFREGRARLLGVVAAESAGVPVALRWTGARPDKLCPPESAKTASGSNG